ncbi:MAG: ribonuclease III [Anaerolineales bacterium]|nr:ribonuclease III [Anaerolineales bacterium]
MVHHPEGEPVESPSTLTQRLGLPIHDVFILTRALTHRSYVNEHPDVLEDNERLEFLGDAILDFVVGAWLYNHFPEMAEGDLTRMRSALVCTEQLAEFAHALDLGPAMRLGRGEIQAGGRDRPVLLCATFEALIGALYLQAGIAAVQRFVEPMLASASDDLLMLPELQDPKSRLQEWSQSHRLGIPHYSTVGSNGPDHERVFEVEVCLGDTAYGLGRGRSKQEAARHAAQAALDSIEEAGALH